LVTLFHPETKEITEVTERAAEVLKKHGWTERVPKKYADDKSDEQEVSK
jgi:hypothetical protein